MSAELRPPSVAHGVISLIWGLAIGLFIWIGLLAIGIHQATAFILAVLSACGIYVFVRICGADRPRSGRAR
jgi:hypothetical protein